jgi:predicted small secreted protein
MAGMRRRFTLFHRAVEVRPTRFRCVFSERKRVSPNGWHTACTTECRVIHSRSFPITSKEIKMTQYFNVFRVVALTVAMAFAAGACNTIQGAGKDIERGGQKIVRAADKAKD